MIRTRRALAAITILWTAHVTAGAADLPSPPDLLTFERSARLVFKTHCFHCHGEGGVTEGGLDLRLRRLIVEGGDSGPAVAPGDPKASYLLDRLVRGEMPPAEVTIRPSEEEIDVVRRWIGAGARTERSEPETADELPRITPEERDHWAFQPIGSPALPAFESWQDRERVRTPVDAFLLARLREQGRVFSPDADRRTLIRRATFDLIGLPPTPDEVDAFVNDESEDAYERLIDRLLASPRYGERWGRHWLDVVGYADSEGYTEADTVRPFAYKYRDYVIESFNADVPFDRFVVEQLAGDEVIRSPLDQLTDEDQRLLVATGFLRMAPDGTGSNPDDMVAATNAVMAETIKIVSSSLMGMTVGCAQCHDHRYDPILHEDYYRLRAVFEPALNWQAWKTPQQRQIPLATLGEQEQTTEIEKRLAEAQSRYDAKETEWIEIVFERELKKVPATLHELAKRARRKPPSERSAEQEKLLADYPNLNVRGGSALDLYLELFEEGVAAKKDLVKLREEVAKIRAELPDVDYIRGLTEPGEEFPTTFVFHRGDPAQPTDAVSPGHLTILDQLLDVDIPENDQGLPSTGRRLALARQLTHRQHPLTVRVLVNRVWMHHFGRGLVTTPGDFGVQGEPPTHPRLLDWLARDFIEHGWSLKRLHRVIMTSTAYRQSSNRTESDFDPDNRYYGRQSIRRLEAETIRDGILFVSGRLSDEIGGPPAPVTETEEGQMIVSADIDAEGLSRRSIYVQVRRSTPLAMLEVFDAPRLEPNCTARTFSTVTPQSLMLMNSEMVVSQSRSFAQRVASEVGDDRETQVIRAWRIALADEPTAGELRASLEFLNRQTDYFEGRDKDRESTEESEDEPSPLLKAFASLCQVLMGSNQFLYVD